MNDINPITTADMASLQTGAKAPADTFPATPGTKCSPNASEKDVQVASGIPNATAPAQAQSTEPQKSAAAEKGQDKTLPDAAPIDSEAISTAVKAINDYVQSIQRELHFNIDDESGETVVTVVGKATQQVVRQIPAADLMESLKNMSSPDAYSSGLIIDNKT